MFCIHIPYFWVVLTTEVYMLGFIVGSSLPDNEDDAFNTSRITSNTRNEDISSCKKQAEKSQCAFYSCMDEVAGCHGHRHSRTLANSLCKAVVDNNDFTQKGWIWAKHTNKCILDILGGQTQDVVHGHCGHVNSRAKNAFVTCAKTFNICDILWSDRSALKSSFHQGSWMTIVEAASECSRRLVTRYIYWNLGG